jgi:hypothetical protein
MPRWVPRRVGHSSIVYVRQVAMNILQQFENGLHAVLPQIEQGVTHILAVAGDRVLLHRILQTGEVVTQEMNVPFVRAILQAVDSIIPQ